jgi:hypothetical protein
VKRESFLAVAPREGDMADIELALSDLEEDALPRLCMKCGAPAVAHPMIECSWWNRRRRAPIPLCQRHRRHWTSRILIAWGGAGLFLLLFLAGLMVLLLDDIKSGNNVQDFADGLAILGAAGLVGLALLITTALLSRTRIDVVEITDNTIVLKNVSPEYKQAYRDQARTEINPNVERDVREWWGRPPKQRDKPPDDKYRHA